MTIGPALEQLFLMPETIRALERDRDQLRAQLVEMTRRRDAWRDKAAGFDVLAAAVRRGVADAGPRNLPRVFLRGAVVEQEIRIEALETERDRLRAVLHRIGHQAGLSHYDRIRMARDALAAEPGPAR